MALIKCKECGAQISSKATACPQCGFKIKKSSGCGCLLGAVFLGLLIFGIATPRSTINPQNLSSNSTSPVKTAREIKSEVSDQLEIDWAWKKAGFGNIMEADFTITNKSSHDIKDIEIRTVQYAKSGTQIDSNTRTIYEIIKAKEKRSFKKFNMGFIHSQSDSAKAAITDFVMLN